MSAFSSKRKSLDKLLSNVSDLSVLTKNQLTEITNQFIIERISYRLPKIYISLNSTEIRQMAEDIVNGIKEIPLKDIIYNTCKKTNKIPEASIDYSCSQVSSILAEAVTLAYSKESDITMGKIKPTEGLLPQ